MTIENPGVHVHRTRLVDGQPICQDCRQVVVVPILSFKEAEERELGYFMLGLAGSPADVMLMELTDKAGKERPDYITKLMVKYEDAGDPPHCSWGRDVDNWWKTN